MLDGGSPECPWNVNSLKNMTCGMMTCGMMTCGMMTCEVNNLEIE